MRILLIFFISNVFWVLTNITFESSHYFWKGNKNSGHKLCIMVCPSFWENYYKHLHPLLGADELSGYSWQLITTICDEGDGLSLCEQLSWRYACTHCCVTFNCCCGEFFAISSNFCLARTNIMVTFKMFWINQPEYYGSLPWVGVVMPYSNSPLTNLVLPGSPVGTKSFSTWRDDRNLHLFWRTSTSSATTIGTNYFGCQSQRSPKKIVEIRGFTILEKYKNSKT